MPSNRCASSTRSAPAPSTPAPDRHLVAPGVEPDGDATRVLEAQLLDQRRPLDRGGADDHPLDAGVEQLAAPASAVRTPPPTSTRHATLRTIRRIWSRCVRLTGAGGVEVDDVDPLRAGGLELAGDPHRVVVVDGLGGEVALAQADAVPAPQVDGGKEVDHGGRQRRALGRRHARCPRSAPRRAARGPRP